MANGEYGDIGLRVRQRREELGLTREKMAERAGLSVQFMASVELGKQSMTTDSLKKVCRALCVSADYIVFGTRPGYSEHDLNAAQRGTARLCGTNAAHICSGHTVPKVTYSIRSSIAFFAHSVNKTAIFLHNSHN